MNQILLILHLFGFGGAVSVSVGNVVVTRLASAVPADAPALNKVRFVLARVSQIALGLLWLTGLILVWSKYGGPGAMSAAFWIKMLLVVAVTVLVAIASLSLKQVRGGNVAAGTRLPLYGGLATALVVLIVIAAVIAFD